MNEVEEMPVKGEVMGKERGKGEGNGGKGKQV